MQTTMSKEMDWDNFIPTREIREYDRRLRESIRQREQLKIELAALEKKPRDILGCGICDALNRHKILQYLLRILAV